MTGTPLKEMLSPEVVDELGRRVSATGKPFDLETFLEEATRGLTDLELKDRARHIAGALRAALPADAESALETLVAALPSRLDGTDRVTEHFAFWPFLQFVEDHAVGVASFEATTAALHAMTQVFSAEFAVRPLLVAEPDRTLRLLLGWTSDPSVHVRRLCSEGTRPRLPWGQRLQRFVDDPTPTLPILEALVDDPEEFVRRSVANHVNDIAKDHPGVAVDLCRRWWETDAPRSGRTARERLVRHALRTLIKNGDRGALGLLGFGPADVRADVTVEPEVVVRGGSFEIALRLRSTAERAQELLVDYAVHFRKADGSSRPKVFKWTRLELAGADTATLRKRHAFRDVTTRRHYAGPQRVEVLVNGEAVAAAPVELIEG